MPTRDYEATAQLCEEQHRRTQPTEAAGNPWHRLHVVLALLIASSLLATRCGMMSWRADPDIGDMTSDPVDYVGQRVKLRGDVSEIFYRAGFYDTPARAPVSRER